MILVRPTALVLIYRQLVNFTVTKRRDQQVNLKIKKLDNSETDFIVSTGDVMSFTRNSDSSTILS
ncbi:MAG: hypothetical protein R2827_04140 [Bdellovibrionales bacterium]